MGGIVARVADGGRTKSRDRARDGRGVPIESNGAGAVEHGRSVSRMRSCRTAFIGGQSDVPSVRSSARIASVIATVSMLTRTTFANSAIMLSL